MKKFGLYSPSGHRYAVLMKGLIIMKITLLLILTSAFNLLATDTYSQTARVSLNLDQTSLKQALKEIERSSEFYFLYNNELIDVERKVDIQADNEQINAILDRLFANQEIKYAVYDRQIVISPANMQLPQVVQRKISGKVTDSSGGELPGVTVLVKGTTTGTITAADGRYSLSDVPPNSTLLFSFVGMKSMEVNVNGKTTISVVLEEATLGIEEVVAIGYGTQSKREVSGAITSITEKKFDLSVTTGLLQGKVAGLSSAGGQTILRGISSLSGSVSPFYVIDGVPDMGGVAPEDIESISVLKDASATAIYGSRAASGVILITTKKGKAGQLLVEYSGKVMIDNSAEKPPLLSASEYRAYAQKMGIDISGSDKGANTDWFKQVMNEGAFSQGHYFSASGGTEKSNYRGSFNYSNGQGTLKGGSSEGYNSFFSFNQKALKDKLDVSFIVGGSKSESNSGGNYYNSIYTLLPVAPVKNPDGTWYETYDWAGGNPVHSVAENKSMGNGYSLYFNSKVNLEIFKGFVAGLNLYTQRAGSESGTYNGKTTFQGNNDHGNASRSTGMSDRNLLEFTLKYLKKINLHEIELLGGYSYEESQSRSFNTSVRGFITDAFGFDNLSAGDVSKYRSGDISSGGSMSKLIGYFGRLNYNFNKKYILSATLRGDGSSKFGANNKWGTFPSVSAAWRISDEPFMGSFEFLSDLKLRLSYGATGNQGGIGPYNSVALYSIGSIYYNNGNWENTYQYSQNPNPNLKWEQTATFNAGLDFSFYKDRISGSVDFYNRKTSDLLYTYPVPVPPYLYSSILANVGDISNKGIEFVINADIIRNQDFRWAVSFNIAHNKQLITRLSNDQFKIQNTYVGYVSGRGQSGSTTHILREGEEISTFYGLKCLGLDKNGMFIYQDVDKNGIIDSNDNQVIGHAMPKATYGLTNTISYKGFDLSFLLCGVYGNDIFNNAKMQMVNPANFPAQVYKEATTTPLRDKMVYSSYYIEKGSFLRLQNASLGYNFNTKKLGINRCKVYIAGENLFVITKYSGMDPERAAQSSGDLLSQGIDPGGLVPMTRRFIFGVNVVF